jgi:transposase
MGSSKQVVPRERRAFSAEFKAEAVRLVAERRAGGASLTQIGRELEVRPDQLRAWVRAQHEAHGAGTGPTGETPQQELRRLRWEVATLRQEQAFAKKWRQIQPVRATACANITAGVRKPSVFRGRLLSCMAI